MKAVLVIWKDISQSDSSWRTQNELDKFITKEDNVVRQLGFVVEDDDDQLVIVDSYFTDKSNYGSATKIPKGCIVSVVPVMAVSKLSAGQADQMTDTGTELSL